MKEVKMYTAEDFDKEKTRVLKYILYKKRTEQEIRNKFEQTIEENLLREFFVIKIMLPQKKWQGC